MSGVTPSTSGITVNQVYSAFSTGVDSASSNLNAAISNASSNANDPTNLIKMQQELSNYNMAMQVQSSVMKSIEDTAKSITQKL
jgi:type III secretion apparatus needle protein